MRTLNDTTRLFVFGALGLIAAIVVLVIGWRSATGIWPGDTEYHAPAPTSPPTTISAPTTSPGPSPSEIDGTPMDDGGGYTAPATVVEAPETDDAHAVNVEVATAWVRAAFAWDAADLGPEPWGPFDVDPYLTPWDAAVMRANSEFGTARGLSTREVDQIRADSDLALRAGMAVATTITSITDLAQVESGSGHVHLSVEVAFTSDQEVWAPLHAQLLFQVAEGRVAGGFATSISRHGEAGAP